VAWALRLQPDGRVTIRALLSLEDLIDLLKLSMAATLFFAATTASAAGLPCSIHPKAGTHTHELHGLAKVTRADAEHVALTSIKAPPSAVVRDGELEVERGCLIYSFDIRVPGAPGIEEVAVDAGTGETLSHAHETPRQEAAERARDATAARVH